MWPLRMPLGGNTHPDPDFDEAPLVPQLSLHFVVAADRAPWKGAWGTLTSARTCSYGQVSRPFRTSVSLPEKGGPAGTRAALWITGCLNE